MEARKYERNRTNTLALRLTDEEKSLIRKRASDSGKSMTDFIVSAALDYSGASVWKPIIKRLDEVRDELQKLARHGKSDDLCDALEALREVYGLVLVAKKGMMFRVMRTARKSRRKGWRCNVRPAQLTSPVNADRYAVFG